MLSIAAVLAVIYGLKQIVQDGFGWTPALAIVGGALFGATFIRRQRVLADPLIESLMQADGVDADELRPALSEIAELVSARENDDL